MSYEQAAKHFSILRERFYAVAGNLGLFLIAKPGNVSFTDESVGKKAFLPVRHFLWWKC